MNFQFFYTIVIVNVILILTISCGFSKKEIFILFQKEKEFQFKDKDSLLTIHFPSKEIQYHYFIHEHEKYYIFERYKNLSNQKGDKKNIEKKLIFRLEIRVFDLESSYFRKILHPHYEEYFQNICNCHIMKKGWILWNNQNVREFHYKTATFSGIENHLNKKKFLIQIALLSYHYDLAIKFWKQIAKEIQFL